MKELRIGIFGTRRGGDYIPLFNIIEGVKVTAVCENSKYSLSLIENRKKDITVFDNFDEFIESGLFDAVLLTNYFIEHAPYAIKAMEHGIHVISECTAACTMAECVELCRTVERTGCKYMLAENYPFFACNLEMKRLYDNGKLGKALYCEGEYDHPMDINMKNDLAPGLLHWRNWLPGTYYITHSLAPIMHITGNTPKSVNCKSIFAPELVKGTASHVGDAASIMLVEMNDGSLARITGCAGWGGWGYWYRICGDRGSAASVRGSLDDVIVRYNDWTAPAGDPVTSTYRANYFDDASDLNITAAELGGHGGSDFWVAYFFAKYLREDVAPFFDVYRAVSMSATAILALRSSQNKGKEYKIPDFRLEEDRKKWENDTMSPFPDRDGNATLPCCSHPDYAPTAEDIASAEKYWKEHGLI